MRMPVAAATRPAWAWAATGSAMRVPLPKAGEVTKAVSAATRPLMSASIASDRGAGGGGAAAPRRRAGRRQRRCRAPGRRRRGPEAGRRGGCRPDAGAARTGAGRRCRARAPAMHRSAADGDGQVVESGMGSVKSRQGVGGVTLRKEPNARRKRGTPEMVPTNLD